MGHLIILLNDSVTSHTVQTWHLWNAIFSCFIRSSTRAYQSDNDAAVVIIWVYACETNFFTQGFDAIPYCWQNKSTEVVVMPLSGMHIHM
jgi:hypothetical protein